MIGVIDYGICNVGSVVNMLKRVGAMATVVRSAPDINLVDRIILPGVGHFRTGMANLESAGLTQAIRNAVQLDRKPLLGICLGMQLLAGHSEEGDCAGLGIIPARVVRFDGARMADRLPIPHMGWSHVVPTRASPLTAGLPDNAKFYFVHSYVVETDDPDLTLLRATYGYDYIAAVQKGRVFGVQFHPEKSHSFGKLILRNFVEMNVD